MGPSFCGRELQGTQASSGRAGVWQGSRCPSTGAIDRGSICPGGRSIGDPDTCGVQDCRGPSAGGVFCKGPRGLDGIYR